MGRSKILFIGGSLNQTTMMHKISMHFNDYDCFFTPFYTFGNIDLLAQKGLLNFTILAGRFKEQTCNYLKANNLKIDYKGLNNNYDLVFTCQDIIIPDNIKDKKIMLVQEGMTDPENLLFYLVKSLKFPRWAAGTSVTGLSDAYELFFVASEGYKDLFIKKGVDPYKIKVTGIPNFDNCVEYYDNNFPYKDFVLVATSDRRETFNYENRKKYIIKSLKIADGRQLIFKLHPNENFTRAISEINRYAPDSIIYTEGNINHMIANCSVLITKYSSAVYVGIALGKEVYSDFDIDELQKLCPIQNNGTSAYEIARIAKRYLRIDDFTENVFSKGINNLYRQNKANYKTVTY